MPKPGHPFSKYPRSTLILLASWVGLLTPYLARLPIFPDSGTLIWLFDLASHWQWLYFAGLGVSTAFLAVVHDRRWAVAFLALPLPFVSVSPRLPTSAAGPVLTVASANVHLDNTDPAALRRWLSAEQPDIAVILEISPPFARQLDTLRDYPHQVVQPDVGPFGIALLSKLPIEDSAVVQDREGIPHVTARLNLNGRPIRVIALHPMPPLAPEYRQIRDEKIGALARAAVGEGVPALIVGDLNATPWSTAFTGLAALGWRRATGLRPTWPAWGRGIFGIPIDHVLASDHWHLVENHAGPAVGSDHYPILVRLARNAG